LRQPFTATGGWRGRGCSASLGEATNDTGTMATARGSVPAGAGPRPGRARVVYPAALLRRPGAEGRMRAAPGIRRAGRARPLPRPDADGPVSEPDDRPGGPRGSGRIRVERSVP